MSDPQPEITPTLESAVEVRADLRQALVEAEDAIAGAAPGRFAEWTEDVLKALAHLHLAFHEHIKISEGEPEPDDGLYHEMLRREPRLRPAVTKLMAEHPVILDAIHQPYGRLKDRAPDEFVPADEIRDAVLKALTRITRHRQKGADLVYEAYFVDLGGLD